MHAAARFRKRFLGGSDIPAKQLKDVVYKHLQKLYKESKLIDIGDGKYQYKDEVWVLIISHFETHTRLKIVTCWKVCNND